VVVVVYARPSTNIKHDMAKRSRSFAAGDTFYLHPVPARRSRLLIPIIRQIDTKDNVPQRQKLLDCH
jgi:hypothetical protein